MIKVVVVGTGGLDHSYIVDYLKDNNHEVFSVSNMNEYHERFSSDEVHALIHTDDVAILGDHSHGPMVKLMEELKLTESEMMCMEKGDPFHNEHFYKTMNPHGKRNRKRKRK